MANLSNVKLVVSDMDGTLLNNEGQVSKQFYKLYQELKKKGILFCAASGRQHNSIAAKLHPIKDEIFIIAENGGIAKKGTKLLLVNFLSENHALKLIPHIRKIEGANLVLCGDNRAFIESNDKNFIHLFQEYYHSFESVKDVIETAKNNALFKLAIYHFKSSEQYVYPVIKKFQEDVLVKISGKNWLDISDKKANKGNALAHLQQMLNISKEETLVIGDYHNDIEMMQQAEFTFAMKNAHQDILNIAKYTTESNTNFGVEKVLQQILAAKN